MNVQEVESKKKSLPLHEWSVVVLFCLILLTLASFAIFKPKSKTMAGGFSHKIEGQGGISVKIEGAVSHPGVYSLSPRATFKQLLERAEPLPNADASLWNNRRRLHDGEEVYIEYRHPIKIRVEGAVESPGEMEILSGTRYSELVDQIPVLPTANLGPLRRKRSFVKEGELIKVAAYKRVKKAK